MTGIGGLLYEIEYGCQPGLHFRKDLLRPGCIEFVLVVKQGEGLLDEQASLCTSGKTEKLEFPVARRVASAHRHSTDTFGNRVLFHIKGVFGDIVEKYKQYDR